MTVLRFKRLLLARMINVKYSHRIVRDTNNNNRISILF